MLVILLFITFFALFIIIINSLSFLAGGKIFKVSQLTYKKALSTCLFILLSAFLLRIVTGLFYAFGIERGLIESLNGIAVFIVGMLIIKKRFNTKILRSIAVYLTSVALVLVFTLFLRSFVVQAYRTPSGAMEPTLLVGDHFLANKFIYGIKIPFIRKTLIPISNPKRDDLIVFIYPHDTSKSYSKRVIGLPGETIEIMGGEIRINGNLYNDTHGVYTEHGRSPSRDFHFRPVIVPEDHLFVMGDNRDHSSDSRVWGFVPLSLVEGKAFIIYWSWPHWRRTGHQLR